MEVTQNASDVNPAKHRVTTYAYADGSHPEDVTSVTDPAGKVWTFDYDPDTGDRVEAADPLGNTTTNVFNDAGWLVEEVSPRGNTGGGVPADHRTVFGHDVAGRTVSVTDPEGGVAERFYNAAGQLVWDEDPAGDRSEYSYDTRGLLVATERADSSTLTATYYLDGSLKSRSDGAGEVTGYGYDAAGRLATVTDPLSRVTSFGYDLGGRRVWRQGAGGNCSGVPELECTRFEYNDSNELIGVEYSDDDFVTPDVTDLVYDGNGRRTSMTDGTGTSSWVWNEFGELVSTTAGNTDVITYSYDKRGLQTSVTYPGNKTVTRTFDDAGRWTGLGDWLGGASSFGYDADSNLTSTTFPAASGNVDQYSFDRADRLSGITYKKASTTLGSISYTRDDNGRVDSADRTSLAGPDEAFEYSPLDQLDKVNTDTLGYDAADNLAVRQDGATQAFDDANQLCWASPSAGSGGCGAPPSDAREFGYDNTGNRVSERSPGGLATDLIYNSADQLVVASVPGSDTAEGQYQALSPSRILDTRNGTGVCSPSPCARLANNSELTLDVTGVGGVPASGYVTAYPSGVSRPTAANVNYAVSQNISNSATVKVGSDGNIKIYTYAAADVVVDVAGYYTSPTGDAASVFHSTGAPARVLDTRTATQTGDCSPGSCVRLTAGSTLTVDVAGQAGVPASGVTAAVLNIVAINPGAGGFLRVYPSGEWAPATSMLNYVTADVLAQMVVAKLGSDGKIKIYSPSAVDLVVDVQGYFSEPVAFAGGSRFAAVSPVRVWDTRSGGSGVASCSSATACDRMTGTEAITLDLSGVAGIAEGGVEAVVLNVTAVNTINNGYLTVFPAGASLNFQNAETLSNTVTAGVSSDNKVTVAVNTPGSADVVVDVAGWYTAAFATTLCVYDGDGYRAAKTTAGVGVSFARDRSAPIPKLISENSASGRTYVVYGPSGSPHLQVNSDNTGLLYYHRDQLGSTTMVTTSTGTVAGTFAYDAYGTPTASTGTAAPLLGYAGECRDSETGYIYLRARYYDPETAQFLTRDPLEQLTADPYGYANNNPTSYVGPLGLCSIVNWLKSRTVEATSLVRDSCRSEDSRAASAGQWQGVGARSSTALMDKGVELSGEAADRTAVSGSLCFVIGCVEAGTHWTKGTRVALGVGPGVGGGISMGGWTDYNGSCPREFTRSWAGAGFMNFGYEWSEQGDGFIFEGGIGSKISAGTVHYWEWRTG